MAWTLGPTMYRNFGPFQKAVVRFDTPGVTVIDAEIAGHAGLSNNAAGKSMLLDGIAWCWYDRCLRERYSGDAIIRHGAKWAFVRTELYRCNAKGDIVSRMRVTRYRNHEKYKNQVRVSVDGVDVARGTNDPTDDLIVRQLGMDFEGFVRAVACGGTGDVRSFFFASDAERKHVFEALLGLTTYAQALTLAKAQRGDVLREIERLTQQFEATAAANRRAHEDRAALAEAAKNAEETNDASIESQARYRQLLRLIEQRREEVKRLRAELKGERAAYDADRGEYDDAMDAWRVSRKESLKKVEAANKDITTSQYAADEARGRAKYIREIAGAPCPTCAKPLSKAEAEAAAKLLLAEAASHDTKADASAIEFTLATREAESHPEPQAPSKVDMQATRREIEVSEAELMRMERDADACKEEAERLRDMAASFDAARIEALDVEIRKGREELARLTQEIDAQNVLREEAEYWIAGFGNAGIKSYLIESELPELNRQTTRYANRLVSPGTRVVLVPVTKLKSKDAERERINVELNVPGLCKSYAGASKGLKKRLDLCLTLAMRSVVARRVNNAVNHLFIDELFDGMDRKGSELVIELLREIAEECPVVLVTHDPNLKHVGDRLIHVRHDGRVASVVASDEKNTVGHGHE